MIHSAWTLRSEPHAPRRLKRGAKREGFWLGIFDVPIAEVWALVTELGDAEQRLWEIVP
jgi:hypothetical protein